MNKKLEELEKWTEHEGRGRVIILGPPRSGKSRFVKEARKLPWASGLDFEERTIGFRAGEDEEISRIRDAEGSGRLEEAVGTLLRRISRALRGGWAR
ncbi:hypothetical protein NAS2_1027 [Conexivisphaera calida]|uniref:ATPase domain-containing protein n=1 Tax=Conexivisphaera calida TaxID=1874277 RepID=A0A4P2VCS9_9ARCH|nr:hypothetical protein NAS2_1027 [Conexivisphaera calida]